MVGGTLVLNRWGILALDFNPNPKQRLQSLRSAWPPLRKFMDRASLQDLGTSLMQSSILISTSESEIW